MKLIQKRNYEIKIEKEMKKKQKTNIMQLKNNKDDEGETQIKPRRAKSSERIDKDMNK